MADEVVDKAIEKVLTIAQLKKELEEIKTQLFRLDGAGNYILNKIAQLEKPDGADKPPEKTN